jgi:hypothetical protein
MFRTITHIAFVPAAPAVGRSLGSRAAQRGSALLAALCFASVLAVAMSSYITLCYRTLEFSTRTAQGSRSIELAEAGMEDALWAQNQIPSDWTGWTIAGTTATKTVTGFSYEGGVTGEIALSVTSYNSTTGPRTITATGTTRQTDGSTLNRTLTATSSPAPLFVNAVAGVAGRVRFRTAGSADSYDSSLGTYASQTPTFSAVIASLYTVSTSATVQLTNAQIKGYVTTLVTGPSYNTGSSGAKLIGPTTPVATRIDTARITTSPYQPLFEEVDPVGGTTLTSLPARLGTLGATTEEVFRITDATLNGASAVLDVDGPVVLVVSGNLSITNSAKIRINLPDGSLRIHVTGDLTINGNGIQNDTYLPRRLFIVSWQSYDSYGMDTTTPFYGVIYTPDSSFTVAQSQTIYGAIVAKAVTFALTKSPVFHYDVSLRNTVLPGVKTPYAVSDLRETTSGG